MHRFLWNPLLGAATAAMLLTACASAPPQTTQVQIGSVSGPRRTVVKHALAQVGTPYDYGGDSPGDGFDCSGLIYYSFLQSGLHVPRTALALWSSGYRVPLKEALPGDLIFYRFGAKPGGLHVGMYLGHDHMVHASTGHDRVIVVNIDEPWWWAHFLAVKRLPALGAGQ